MYKSAGYRVFTDSAEQQKLESRFAPILHQQLQHNLQAFRQHIPAIADLLRGYQSQRYSLLCEKAGYLNIVDFSVGQVLYPDDPFVAAKREVDAFLQRAPLIYLSEPVSEPYQPLSDDTEVVVMLGLGFGYQLLPLLHRVNIKHLIIYEPDTDILACSVQTADWAAILRLAQSKGTALYLQVGQDGSGLPSDLAELQAAVNFEQFALYRHYSHPVMDKVKHHLQQYSGNSAMLLNSKLHFHAYSDLYDEVDARHGDPLGIAQISAYQDQTLYQKNLAALQKYYPQVHSAITQHKSRHWQLVKDSHGKANLYHSERQVLFYQDYQTDSEQLVSDFCQHPFQDDVLIGSSPSYKLRSYLHQQKVRQLMPILERSVKKRSQLPKELDSLILFGIALGEHVKLLLQQHQVKHLYLCEPNLDFFSASLHTTDWAALFDQIAEQGGRLYLNLGGDGSEYFLDLMRQFYQVGAFSIANTHLLTSYYNNPMNKAISELRDNLRVVLAMGEYFDHARFGIAHTYGNFSNGAGILRQGFGLQRHAFQQLPVFIIGNGPSLDKCFDYLHQYKDQAVIISCGTALKALHKQGIKPDFHAELEQNRATYEWVSQVEDPEYLKQITLVSVNGVHPDTMALFKDTLLCFKDGEASTQLFQAALKANNIQTESLSFAYPTVTNMVMNMVLRLGFESIYLFGVDLGFVDINYHHSRSSAYYKQDGSQIYDYQKAHGGGLPTPGNFLPFVFTKPEFDVSRKLIEQSIAHSGRRSEVYNCSNGVKIVGATALLPENILLAPVPEGKQYLLQQLLSEGYQRLASDLPLQIVGQLDLTMLGQTVESWLELLSEEVVTEQQAAKLIEKQWAFLLRTKLEPGNPTFILLNGSTNYFSAIMLKLVSTDQEDNSQLAAFLDVLAVWREYLTEVLKEYPANRLKYDEVSMHYLFSKPKEN
ncbi:6-hydroxymethylpterin diphosphokinase MptE-like protein [Rheinheimera aquimaris]|uniref:motility associated factor glycosyltransferase family protein n=1 Tax=Rheinheimera aquimaris TaxID=412437 RepID=UPI003A97223E